jgi:hypothetical protein
MDRLSVNWRYFSLHQVNHKGEVTWKIWDQPALDRDWMERDYARSLRSFWGAEAARRQGEEAFDRFHRALLQAKHQDDRSLAQPETLLHAAETAELDMVQFRESLGDPSCLERLAADHTRAKSMDVFGTPTFVFPGAVPVYLKLSRIPDPAEALEFWEEFHRVVTGMPFVLEIKRPH